MNGQGTSITDQVTRNWWMLALRGLAAVLFGVLALVWPGITLLILVTLFGAYALIDGIFALVGAYRAPKGYPRFGRLIFIGLISIAAGIIAFAWPHITALALLFLIAVWAIVAGVTEIATAIELRKVITHEWLLILAGIVAVLFGIAVLVHPAAGALAMIWLIGAFAIIFGILLTALSFRARHWARLAPPAAGPAPA